MIFFSIIVPAYNRPKLVERAIRSIENQTYRNFEVILIDDCSNESFQYIINNSKINIKYYRNETNVGGGESRNIGIRNSTGDYIAFLDSDDIWESTKLQKANEILQSSGASVFFNASKVLKNKSITIAHFPNTNKYQDYLSLIIQGEALLQTSSFIVKHKIASEILFDATIPRYQDLDFYLRIKKYYSDTIFHDEPLSTWDISHESNSITKSQSFDWSLAWLKKNKPNLGDYNYYQFFIKFIYSRDTTNHTRGLKIAITGLLKGKISTMSFLKYSIIKTLRGLKNVLIK